MNERLGKVLAVILVVVAVAAIVGVAFFHKKLPNPIKEAGPDALIPGKSEVVFTTSLGTLVFKLYPNLAPKHVEQFLRLVGAGVYQGSTVMRIEKNFVVQIDAVYARPAPMTKEQEALVVDIPAEFSNVKHVRRTLSMARYDDVNSARASFSIVLGTFPHMDGVYTVFGEMLEESEPTLKQIEALPVVAGTTKPEAVFLITKTELREHK